MVNATTPSQGRSTRSNHTGAVYDRFGSTLYGTLVGDEEVLSSRDMATRRPYVPTLRATRHEGPRMISPMAFQRNPELGRTRTSIWPEFPVPVAQMLNNESRTRLMVNRLNDLISQLCALRVRAVSLSETSAQISTSALQINLGGLDNSLILLDNAIKDLEDRVISATRRLDRASGRSISDWVTIGREPLQADGFTSSPSQSLISRARTNIVSNPNAQSAFVSGQATSNLPDRLGHFSESLANLNSRLDRVASNFRNMQDHEAAESSSLISWMNDRNDETTAPWNEILESNPADSTAMQSNDRLMPESGQNRTTSEPTSNAAQSFVPSSITAPAWHEGSFLDLLQPDRHTTDASTQQTESSRTLPQPDDHDSLRMREMSNETYAARSQHRQQQEELLKDETPSRRNPASQIAILQDVQRQDEYEFPRPKLSSHVPLFRNQERIFVDGVEYRNCLGLWLSYTGEHAPAHALPEGQNNLQS